jgi:murein endopeptidase
MMRLPIFNAAVIAILLLLFVLPACTPVRVDPGAIERPATGDHSESVGRPNGGSLRNAVQLPQTAGFRQNNPDRTWGTRETVMLLQSAVEQTLEKYPDTCDLFIGDISTRRGGKLSPHISHQSGRDIDIGLYAKGNRFVYFIPFTRDNLDIEKTWYFIEALLLSDRVQLILLDRKLQKLLYEYLEPVYPKRKLRKILQYPRRNSERMGIIRHAPGHGNHLHVRLKCPRGDSRCETW